MEEDPKEHDFDQRHDGPFEAARPSIQLRRRSSKNPSSPDEARSPASPFSGSSAVAIGPVGRKSTQHTRHGSSQDPITAPGRSSTQMSRGPRSSRDFDVRRDGPYGRPSLTMSRRRSSGQPLSPERTHGSVSEAVPVPGSQEEKDRGRPEGDAVAPSIETLQTLGDTPFEPEPPPLNYELYSRRWHIIWFWGLILIDCIAMPIALYFCLHEYTDLSPNTVFSIVTAALGGVSIMEYVLRFWRLWKKGSTVRVIGARRAYLDWFHWNFSFGWLIIMIELIVGTIPKNPPIRLLAMPVASMLYAFGTELLIVDILRIFKVPAPIRISSVPKGSQLRPCVYSIIEDVCAVDGSGGTAFREALNKRYEASHVFRAMLRRLGVFWAVGAETVAVVITILVFTIDGNAAYVVGWSAPFVWAGIWTLITYLYVKKKLKEEKKAWADELAAKGAV